MGWAIESLVEGTGTSATICFRCNKSGHMIQNCPIVKQESIICFQCGVKGHQAKSCPTKDICYRCNVSGHIARNCPNIVDRRRREKSLYGATNEKEIAKNKSPKFGSLKPMARQKGKSSPRFGALPSRKK